MLSCAEFLHGAFPCTSMSQFSTCFTGLADAYAAARPDYPPQAFDAMLEGLPRPVHAADVGCGTGISTRQLAAAGATVIGFDPNADMLEKARATPAREGSEVSYREGTAEATGLESGSVALVLCAQAFHWFDADASLREFHRILAPGGRLALMWNMRTDGNAFTRGLNEIIDEAMTITNALRQDQRRWRASVLRESPLFHDVAQHTFDNPHRVDESSLVNRLSSASYFPRSGSERNALLERAHRLFAEHATDGAVTIAQQTELTLAMRHSG